MESPSEEKRRAHIINIDSDETVMTAFPYRPHNSLLDLLKGEPKVLGVSSALSWIIPEWEKGASSPFFSLQRLLCAIVFIEGVCPPPWHLFHLAMYPSAVKGAH